MKKTLRLCATLLLLACSLSLFACGPSKKYADQVPIADITSAFEKNTVVFRSADEDFLAINLSGIASLCSEAEVRFSEPDTNISEYGIFHAKDSASAKDVKKLCEDYLSKKKQNWNYDYLPEEGPKMKNATVAVFGNYVVYMILGESERTALTQTLTEKLTVK